MYYTAKHNETGEVVTMTEAQVRAEIINDFQNDMGTVFGEGKTDEEIAQGVTESNIEDFFDGSLYEGANYEITRNAQ
jgi:hypothetical protein